MATKLQNRLASLHNTSTHTGPCKRKQCGGQSDNISISSSLSCHSENEQGNINTDAPVNRTQKIQEESKELGSDFGNCSFASIPYSLPAHLDYQFPVLIHGESEPCNVRCPNFQSRDIESSLASREDLQCNWTSEQISRQTSITTHDADPLHLIPPGI